LFAVLVATLTLSYARLGEAQSEVKQGDAATAEALFQRGRDAFAAEDWDTACKSFEESFNLDHAAGTAMNLASCEEKRGKLASAWEAWHQALRLLPRTDRRREFAEKRLAELDAELPRLTIVLKGEARPNVSITRDGIPLGTASLGLSLPVDVGPHTILVKAPGYETRTYQVTSKARGAQVLDVETGPALITGPETGKAGSSLRTWSYVAGGVGLAGFAGAIVTAAMLPAAQETVDDECVGSLCSSEGLDAAKRGDALLVANTISWIVGGVGVSTGAVLFVMSLKDTNSNVSAQVSASTDRVIFSGTF
jgi:hypothetical protein